MNDLTIENYSFGDLLKLFELSENFNEYELKNAKKIVLRLHPDKSGLPSEYFLFYSKAYKMLYNIWIFKNKSLCKNEDGLWKKDDDLEMVMDDNLNEKKKLVVEKTKTMSDVRQFNKWFNDEFEKSRIVRDGEDGYGDWFRNNDDGEIIMDNGSIESHKKRVKDLIVYDGVQELPVYSSGYFDLNDGNNKVDGYSSELFSDLPYQDLYVAHTIPIIPVSENDFSEQNHFQNIDEYKKHSDAVVKESFDNCLTSDYFTEKTKKQEEASSQLAYRLAREVEESEKKNKKFWSNFNLLK